jgi:hypothetical protein
MEGRELHEDILREVSSDGPPYEVEVYYDGQGNMFSRAAGLALLNTMIRMVIDVQLPLWNYEVCCQDL